MAYGAQHIVDTRTVCLPRHWRHSLPRNSVPRIGSHLTNVDNLWCKIYVRNNNMNSWQQMLTLVLK